MNKSNKISISQHKHYRHRKPKKQQQASPDESNGIVPNDAAAPGKTPCTICADDVIFAGVGPCNHPVCSKCLARLRLKSRDMNCPLCKSRMEHVVVFYAGLGLKPFLSFDVDFEYEGKLPNINVDAKSKMHYYHCKSHFDSMQTLQSFACPQCHQRFPSYKSLSKHLSSEHSRHFCSCCFEHRPFFTIEHALYTAAELKDHQNAPPSAGGHPECKFCNSYCYDNYDLYQHMRNKHHSCHLCPTAFQHRYYNTAHDFYNHLKQSHLTCTKCRFNHHNIYDLCFTSHADYAAHMESYHSIRNAPLPTSFHSTRGPSISSQYLDIHVNNTTNPYEPSTSAVLSNPSSDASPNTTSITERQADIASVEEFPSLSSRMARPLVSYPHPYRRNDDDFPSLNPEGDANKTNVHPMSLIPAVRARQQRTLQHQQEMERQRQLDAQIELRRQQRNERFAEALGVKLSVSTLAAGVQDALFQDLEHVVTDKDLKTPLYPFELMIWARDNRTELLKTEKRIQTELLSDSKVNSIQLKPMRRPAREAIAELCKYYKVNPYEYSLKDRKYLSLVKSIESVVPSRLLSQATCGDVEMESRVLNSITPTSIATTPLPLLYIYPRFSAIGSTLGDVLNMLGTVHVRGGLKGVRIIGGNLVELHFTSTDRARAVYELLLAAPATSPTTTISNYHIIPNFVVTVAPTSHEESLPPPDDVVCDNLIAVYDPDDQWHAKLIPAEQSSVTVTGGDIDGAKNQSITEPACEMDSSTRNVVSWLPGNEPQRRAHSVEKNSFLALADDSGSDDDMKQDTTKSSYTNYGADYWPCSRCTYHNLDMFSEFCSVCEQSRFI